MTSSTVARSVVTVAIGAGQPFASKSAILRSWKVIPMTITPSGDATRRLTFSSAKGPVTHPGSRPAYSL